MWKIGKYKFEAYSSIWGIRVKGHANVSLNCRVDDSVDEIDKKMYDVIENAISTSSNEYFSSEA
jgi:hypothetical protein